MVALGRMGNLIYTKELKKESHKLKANKWKDIIKNRVKDKCNRNRKKQLN